MNQLTIVYTVFSMIPMAIKVALKIEVRTDADNAWLQVACAHMWWNRAVLAGMINYLGQQEVSRRFDACFNMGEPGVIRFFPGIGGPDNCLGVFSPKERAEQAAMFQLLSRCVSMGGDWERNVENMIDTPDPLTVSFQNATPEQRRARRVHLQGQ